MAIGTNAVITVKGQRDYRVQGAVGVVLVALGIVTGLLIGGIARQDDFAMVGESQAMIGQVVWPEDYALRHPAAGDGTESVAQVSRLDDYALRHPTDEAAIQSVSRVFEVEDYALRHAGETP